MKKEIKLCISSRDHLHRKKWREKPVDCLFDIKHRENEYMCYVTAQRMDKWEKKTFYWNSLWKIWKMSLSQINKKIDSYKWIDEVISDFNI